MKLKLLLVGSFTAENSTNVFLSKAFKKAGHIVEEFDYRLLASQIGPAAMNAGLVYEAMKTTPDLIFICKGDQLGISTIVELNKQFRTYYHFMDPIITAAPHLLNLAKECTYVSCTGLGVAKHFVNSGVEKVFHILEGVDPEYYYPVSEDSDFKTDVSFIGSRTAERMNYIYELGTRSIVRVYGNGFGADVKGADFRKICSSSKIMLSINSQNNIEEYFSDRVFLYLACKSFVFQKYTPGLENYFENEKHLVWFHDSNELIALTNEWLDPSKEIERRLIAETGYNYVLNQYTWDVTVGQIMGCIKDYYTE